MCCPFSILENYPDLVRAFRSCGCDPELNPNGVGVLLVEDYHKVLAEKNAQKTNSKPSLK
jgi:hypothetical protein